MRAPRPAARSSRLAPGERGGLGQRASRRAGSARSPRPRGCRVAATAQGPPPRRRWRSATSAASREDPSSHACPGTRIHALCFSLCLPISSVNGAPACEERHPHRRLLAGSLLRRRSRPARRPRACSWSRSGARPSPRPTTSPAPPGDREPGLRGRGGGRDPPGQGRCHPADAVPRHQRRRLRRAEGAAASAGCSRWRFAPDYASSGLFYVFYTRDDRGGEPLPADRGVPPLRRQPGRRRSRRRGGSCSRSRT